MFGRILRAALIAGLAAGLVTWAVHTLKAVPLILEAETYEHAEVADGTPVLPAGDRDAAVSGTEAQAFGGRLDRRAMVTLIADLGLGVGFALALIGLIALSGRDIDFERGLLWGLGGFAAVAAAPALGLPRSCRGSKPRPCSSGKSGGWRPRFARRPGLGCCFLPAASGSVYSAP